jgi:translation initiation factor IF-3
LSRPFPPRHAPSGPSVRINGKIRAREVRVIGDEGQQLGVMPLGDAIALARNQAVDLVEVAPNAAPPVCRLVDFGKYKYEQEKRQKENRKHHHANKVKEIQLSATIDPHDFQTKLSHAVDFLCEDMKVKASLRFRGREMAHTEFGFQVIRKFIAEIAPWGHPDFDAKLTGRSINVMISPLPKNKRAKHPDGANRPPTAPAPGSGPAAPAGAPATSPAPTAAAKPNSSSGSAPAAPARSAGFANNPFETLKVGGS